MASTGQFANVHHVNAYQSIFNEAGRDIHVHNTFNPSTDEREILAMLQPLKREGHARRCMEGTRKEILNEIIAWTNDSTAPNVLLLTGSPGAGKSTIAASIVAILSGQKRLGCSIAFKHNDTNLSNPTTVWPTVAYDLTRFHPIMKQTILEILRGVDPGSSDIELQFERVIEKPLLQNELPLSHPAPVVVLDALDECGFDSARRDQRKVLINTLVKWQSLSPQFKMIVTSRNEGLPPNFVSACKHMELHTGDNVDLEAKKDIKHFLETSFSEISSRYMSLASWPEEQVVERLTREAAGLFIWVDTLVHFIDNEENTPDIQLDLILGGDYGDEGDTMSRLYSHILDIKFGKATRNILEAFHAIIGIIVLAKVPLQCKALIHFLDREITEPDIDFVLHKLSSVLSIGEEDKKIHFCHLSFREFLCDPHRSQRYAIDLPVNRMKLAEICFKVMGHHLKFNICHLPTSHLKNSDVDDLQDRIEKYIPDELVYACCFGIQHALDTQLNDLKPLQEHKSIKDIYNFLCQQLLYWLEVMSLIGEVKTAQVTLLWLVGCISEISNNDLTVLADDAAKFAVQFGDAIQTSASHVYLSALPWSPRNSSIAQYYLWHFPLILSFAKDQETAWTALRTIMSGHSSQVTSVSFSPDGKLVASGSYDKTICIWETETGKVVAGPFEGHSDWVTSVSFSPDGKLVASGSFDKTICIWDAETGKMAAGPFEGHSDCVTSVSFSPDGKLVASGSYDKTICIWDAVTGKVATGPFDSHNNTVTSVSFSPDGKLVASGSFNKTICIWDAETGKVAAGPFEGHSHWVSSVSFSPDGKLVASGSWDKTICIWETETGKVAAGPFEGHSQWVTSVSFSPDGKLVASGSYDKTICIWDAETGKVAAGPFDGHNDTVTSVSFSPDGKLVASGSDDSKICIWDAETGKMAAGPGEGYSDWVTSVNFSPDGTLVASGSWDKTICIWDAKTGKVAAGPFEGHSDCVTSVSFSPDGKFVASGSWDKTICIWDAVTGKVAAGPFEGHSAGVTSVSFSPDGKFVASGSSDKAICIWDAVTGKVAAGPFEGHSAGVTSVSFSPDGKLVASGSDDKTICIWDAVTGKVAAGPFEGHSAGITSVSFSPDGKLVASGSREKIIYIWDAKTGKVAAGPFEGHSDLVTSVSFSPDGKLVASGSHDKTICIWDAETGKMAAGPFEGHSAEVTSVNFSPDGKLVVSGSWDRKICIWEVETSGVFFDSHRNAPIDSSQNFELSAPEVCDTSAVHNSKDFHCCHYDPSSGWMKSPDGKGLLFWVPPQYRGRVCGTDLHAILGCQSIMVELDNFANGINWTMCYNPQAKAANLVPAFPMSIPEIKQKDEVTTIHSKLQDDGKASTSHEPQESITTSPNVAKNLIFLFYTALVTMYLYLQSS